MLTHWHIRYYIFLRFYSWNLNFISGPSRPHEICKFIRTVYGIPWFHFDFKLQKRSHSCISCDSVSQIFAPVNEMLSKSLRIAFYCFYDGNNSLKTLSVCETFNNFRYCYSKKHKVSHMNRERTALFKWLLKSLYLIVFNNP